MGLVYLHHITTAHNTTLFYAGLCSTLLYSARLCSQYSTTTMQYDFLNPIHSIHSFTHPPTHWESKLPMGKIFIEIFHDFMVWFQKDSGARKTHKFVTPWIMQLTITFAFNRYIFHSLHTYTFPWDSFAVHSFFLYDSVLLQYLYRRVQQQKKKKYTTEMECT